ncbi:hypothetical protein HYW74_01930 [Candidatus Pacearchaeota archaeon]|nr:hypothetical protein [Candidatus Pacearchaeota archaeon]
MNKRGKSLFLIFGIIFLVTFVYAANFSDISQSNFNNGTFLNSSYNGSAVVLSASNLSGTFTSRVFDAISISSWDNFSLSFSIPTKEYIYAVDAQSDVWNSTNSGVNWSLVKDDYNNGDGNGVTSSFFNKSGSYFIIFNQDVWRSENLGINWTKLTGDYNGAEGQNAISAALNGGNLMYIIEGDEDVWVSNNSGVNWSKTASNFNGGNGNVFGFVVNSSSTLIAADNQADIWMSSNNGTTWTLIKDDYNGAQGNNVDDMAISSNDTLYILDVQDVWKSNDSGISWNKINDDFNGAGVAANGQAISVDSQGNVHVIDGNEDAYKSTDGGVTFSKIASNINGANGLVGTMTAILKTTNVTFQVKTCFLANCSDGIFIGPGNSTTAYFSSSFNNLKGLNLTGRYFQYKAYLTSQDAGIAPQLFNTSIEYTILDNSAPNLTIISPANQNYTNATILVNISAADSSGISGIWFYNGSTNITYTTPISYTFAQGSNTIIAYVNDTFNNLNYTNRSFFVDSQGPNIDIILPEARTYSVNNTLPLNFSVSDSGIGVSKCWYNLNNGANNTINNCQNITFNVSGDGNHALRLYANDTLGNVNFAARNFSVNTQLAVSLEAPNNGKWLSNGNNVQFNYNVNTFATIKNCSLFTNASGAWNINKINSSAVNTSGGINNFMINFTDGSYLWNVYCTDTFSAFALNNFTINIDSLAPNLSVSYPANNTLFKRNLSLQFNFSVSDLNLGNCWHSFNKGSNNNSVNCINGNNNISFGQINGTYNLTVYANDSANNLASFTIYNLTIQKDITNPSLILSQPIGAKSSKTDIPLQFSISDNADQINELTCSYNVTFASTNGLVSGLENVLVSGCSSTSFSVPSDSDYILHFYTRDISGNINYTNSSFSVSTSSGGGTSGGSGGSGGGSGGGGGSSGSSFGLVPSTTLQGKLEVSSIGNIIINPGENKKLTLGVKNSGLSFLNSCRLVGSGEYSSWIESSESKKLGGGESSEFLFSLNVPNDAKEGKYRIGVSVECSEKKETTSFDAEIIEQKLAFNILEVKREQENGVRVRYSIEEVSGIRQNVEMQFLLFNSENQKIAEIKDTKSIAENSAGEFEVLIPIDPSAKGDFNLLVNINSETYSTFVQESVVLSTPVSGFAIFQRDAGTDNIIAGVIVVLFLVFAFFMVSRIMKFKKQTVKTRDFR